MAGVLHILAKIYLHCGSCSTCRPMYNMSTWSTERRAWTWLCKQASIM